MAEIAFFLSVTLAHAMTNFDNLAVMLVLAPLVGVRRCLSVYLITQAICIAVSGMAGVAAIELLGAWVGYLGCIPIGLGLFALWQRVLGGDVVFSPRPTSMGATVVLFFGLGLDTTVVMSAILGDSSQIWRGLAYLGAGASLCGLAALFLLMVSGRIAKVFVERMSRFAPFAMIAVGVYILSDSGSDVV